VLNIVNGFGEDAGAAIVVNPRVKAISFTGGVPTGKIVYAAAAQYLKPVELELGGKNAQIVMEDANLDLALEGVLFGAFGTAGQRCTATSRLILHEPIYEQFLQMLIDRTEELRLGDPLDPQTDVGPVLDEAAGESILRYIEIGRQEATIMTGGYRLTGGIYDGGFFIKPTIFETRHGTRISTEEIFGPVLSVIGRQLREAVEVANDVEYGLSSSTAADAFAT
jgi:aldehyde dehydrogenase (NAD+)